MNIKPTPPDYSLTVTFQELDTIVEPIQGILNEWVDDTEPKLITEWNNVYKEVLDAAESDNKFVWEVIKILGHDDLAKTVTDELGDYQKATGFIKMFMSYPDNEFEILQQNKSKVIQDYRPAVIDYLKAFSRPPSIGQYNSNEFNEAMNTIIYPKLRKNWRFDWRDLDLIKHETLRPLNNMMERYLLFLIDDKTDLICTVGSEMMGIILGAKTQIEYIEKRNAET